MRVRTQFLRTTQAICLACMCGQHVLGYSKQISYGSVRDHPKCITGDSPPEGTEHALTDRDRGHFIDARLELEQHLITVGCSRYFVLIFSILQDAISKYVNNKNSGIAEKVRALLVYGFVCRQHVL